MDQMLYVAMSGARQIENVMATTLHNLANAQTPGFRADFDAMRAMPVYGPGLPTRVYAMAERPGIDHATSPLMVTGNDFDVAIQGEGFFVVQAPDGGEAYTRRGDLRVTATGSVETGDGFPVLGDGGPLSIPPSSKIEIAADGTISVLPNGQPATALASVGRIRMVNPDTEQLTKGADGLFRMKDGSTALPDARVRLVSGSLESSNVNTVEALVGMIEASRAYEMQVRLMRDAQENDAASAQTMRLA